MKYYIIALLLALTVCKTEYSKEENVYVLTDDNFDEFIKEHEHVLVKFYVRN